MMNQQFQKRTFIFDFDGTICNSVEVGIRLINEQAKAFRYRPIEPSEHEQLRNLTTMETMKLLGISNFKLPFLVSKLRKEIYKEMDSLEAYEGMVQVLRKLKEEGHSLGILTSNAEENVRRFLGRNELEVFDFIHSKSSVFGKARQIKKLLKARAISSDSATYVGDEVRDIVAAKEAGIAVIAVSWGAHSRELLQKHSPDFIADSPDELRHCKWLPYLALVFIALICSPAQAKKQKQSFLDSALSAVEAKLVPPPQDQEVCFSPDEPCAIKLQKMIESAKKSIDVAIFDITLDQVAHTLLVASKKIPVRIVVDRRQAKGQHSLVPLLIKAGAQVRIGHQRGIMHHKFTIVDGTFLETGSFNYTNHASTSNHENQVYLTNPTIVKRYQEHFSKLWSEASPP